MHTVSTKCRQRKMRALKHLNRARPSWVSALAAAASALNHDLPEKLHKAGSSLREEAGSLDTLAHEAESLQSCGDVSETIAVCERALSRASLVSGLATQLVAAVAEHKLKAAVAA